MGTYCTNCGRQVQAGGFCPNCGKRVVMSVQPQPIYAVQQGRAPAVPGSYYPAPGVPVKTKRIKQKKKATPLRKAIRIILLVLVAAIIGGGAWYAGDMTGLWARLSLAQVADDWKKQDGYKEADADIKTCLNELADALEAGDTDSALAYVDPNKTDEFRALFTDNAASLPNLVYALRNNEVSFYSTEDSAYATLGMASVTGALPGDSAEGNSIMITMIKLENGWVVASL